jgi:nicotinate-nucleotide adenylyltransferase
MQPIGLFGGAFDPIHVGHLRTAFELWQELRLAEVRFVPTGNPAHREQLNAPAELRVAMVKAAVADQPAFVVDDREVRRTGVSYSVDTLTEIRAEYPARSLCLLLGMDAFLGLPHWHRWRELLGLAHIVVAHRPGWKAPTSGPLGEVMVDHGTGSIRELHEKPCGRVYVHAGTQLEISSTELRQLLVAGRDPLYLVPDRVRQIVRETRCYAGAQTRLSLGEPSSAAGEHS